MATVDAKFINDSGVVELEGTIDAPAGFVAAPLALIGTDPATVPLTVTGAPGQGVPLLETYDSNGTLLFKGTLSGCEAAQIVATDAALLTAGNSQIGQVNNDSLNSNGLAVYGYTGTGSPFTVYDGAFNKVFEIQDDGSVHILTGTTVVADL
jgi:hypothetical protein